MATSKKSGSKKNVAAPVVVKANAELSKRGYAVLNPANDNKPITQKIQAGHAIQAIINDGPVTVAELAKRMAPLGVSESRVRSHVAFEQKKERLSVTGKNELVKLNKQPMWRTAGADGKKKIVKPLATA